MPLIAKIATENILSQHSSLGNPLIALIVSNQIHPYPENKSFDCIQISR